MLVSRKLNEDLSEVFCNPSSGHASLKCRLIHATVLRNYNLDKRSHFLYILRLKILGGLEGFIISLVFNSTASLLLGYEVDMKLIKSNIFFEIFTINCREIIKAISAQCFFF